MTNAYDIITVGGGLAGSGLARSMAERGYRVLVVERETEFRDRVRGEWLAPWGVAEARELGLYDLLLGSCGYHPQIWDTRMGSASVGDRDLSKTTPAGLHSMTFYHPKMQETVLDAASQAGADVRRGVRVTGIETGREPAVRLEWNGSAETASARLVVGADGRGSPFRKWAGIEISRVPEQNQLCGLFFESIAVPQDRCLAIFNPFSQRFALSFPQGNGRGRVYFANRADEGVRPQGEKDIPTFIQETVNTGMPAAYFEGARPAGPLATFAGNYEWADRPYRDGVALVGDSASTSDPTWGQGLSLTLRSVRALRDALLTDDDWDAAGVAYAEDHRRYWDTLRTVEGWWTDLFFGKGPEA
ncbi:MAG TPA: NAD(P)/FAD-dependent oxidoreductase, partial [Dehalococcoidia bacterium]|nr:NAD(P)/FAD-dependent oxidoreductase [Dehalococcoidia bacterium]